MSKGLPPPPDRSRPSAADAGTPPAGAPRGLAGRDATMLESSSDEVADYVRANAGRYTRDAIAARLTSAGHSPETIAVAWATVDQEDAREGRGDRRGAVSAFIGGAYLLTWLALTAAWLLSDPERVGDVASVSGFLGAVLFVPGLVGFLVARRSRQLERAKVGTAVAFLFAPLLLLAAIAGTCVALVPPMGFPG